MNSICRATVFCYSKSKTGPAHFGPLGWDVTDLIFEAHGVPAATIHVPCLPYSEAAETRLM